MHFLYFALFVFSIEHVLADDQSFASQPLHYSFQYANQDDGQHQRQETGRDKSVSGFYSYVDPYGHVRKVRYLANEKGYFPQGDISVDKETAAQAYALAVAANQAAAEHFLLNAPGEQPNALHPIAQPVHEFVNPAFPSANQPQPQSQTQPQAQPLNSFTRVSTAIRTSPATAGNTRFIAIPLDQASFSSNTRSASFPSSSSSAFSSVSSSVFTANSQTANQAQPQFGYSTQVDHLRTPTSSSSSSPLASPFASPQTESTASALPVTFHSNHASTFSASSPSSSSSSSSFVKPKILYRSPVSFRQRKQSN